MQIKSKRGARRRYNALLNKAHKELRGGALFGIDWPTLRICLPEIYEEIQQLRAMYASLPE